MASEENNERVFYPTSFSSDSPPIKHDNADDDEDLGMSAEWSAEKSRILIAYIKREPIIWDTRFPDYKNKPKRAEALQRISEVIEVSPDEVLHKFQNLRITYRYQIRKLRQGAKSKWLLFNEMHSFLKDVPERRGNNCKTSPGENRSEIDNESFNGNDASQRETENGSFNTDSESSRMKQDNMEDDSLTAEWSAEKSRILISYVKQEQSIWDPAFPDHNNRAKRAAAIKRIAKLMDLKSLDVHTKFRTLRTYYRCQIRKLRSGELKRSKWILFDAMHSLLHYVTDLDQRTDANKVCKSSPVQIKNASDVDDESLNGNDVGRSETEDESLNMEATAAQHTDSSDSYKTSTARINNNSKRNLRRLRQRQGAPPPPSKQFPEVKRSRTDESTSSFLTSSAPPPSQDAEHFTPNDPEATFGLHVANELRLITSQKAKQFAKLQIVNILFNAQFGLPNVPVNANKSQTSETDK